MCSILVSDRNMDIFCMRCSGYKNKDISKIFNISRSRVSEIYKDVSECIKLHASASLNNIVNLPGITTRVYHTLIKNGIKTISQIILILKQGLDNLLNIKDIGTRSLQIILNGLKYI